MSGIGRGHRERDHTADTIVEAWGPDRAGCLEEAVAGLAAVYAEVPEGEPRGEHPVTLEEPSDSALLVALLSEALFLLDAEDRVAVRAELSGTDSGGVRGRLLTVPADQIELSGAVPKAVTYHGLEIGPDESGSWRCRVTLDL